MNISKTGEGSYTPTLVTDIDLTIKEMLGAQVSGLQNSYDCDTQVISKYFQIIFAYFSL